MAEEYVDSPEGELAEVTGFTSRLSDMLVAAIKAEPDGLVGGENLARLLKIKFASKAFRDRYIFTVPGLPGGWTEDSEAIEVSKVRATGDNAQWFHPHSGNRMRE